MGRTHPRLFFGVPAAARDFFKKITKKSGPCFNPIMVGSRPKPSPEVFERNLTGVPITVPGPARNFAHLGPLSHKCIILLFSDLSKISQFYRSCDLNNCLETMLMFKCFGFGTLATHLVARVLRILLIGLGCRKVPGFQTWIRRGKKKKISDVCLIIAIRPKEI